MVLLADNTMSVIYDITDLSDNVQDGLDVETDVTFKVFEQCECYYMKKHESDRFFLCGY